MSELLNLNEFLDESVASEVVGFEEVEESYEDAKIPIERDSDDVILAIAAARDELKKEIKDSFKDYALSARLYDDLRKYQDDVIWQAVSPMVRSIINLANTVDSQVEYLENEDTSTKEEIERLLYFKIQLIDILYEYNIEEIKTEDNVFDPKKQKILSTVPTTDRELNGRVCAIKHSGFMNGAKVIVKEQVTVYKYE